MTEIKCAECDAVMHWGSDQSLGCLFCDRAMKPGAWRQEALDKLLHKLFGQQPAWIERQTIRVYPGGSLSYVVALTLGQGRIVYGSDSWIKEFWQYETLITAVGAHEQWHPSGVEPVGWCRHHPSKRRRPDGDPAKEYVRE
jgi:hypothetical protein